jgi:Flp pilus assembly protein TadG
MLTHRKQRGQALIWVAILLPLFLALVGLVFDGGLLWQQYLRARWAVSAAGVAAASEIDPDTLAQSGRIVLKAAALNTASRYAHRNDPALRITNVRIVTQNGQPYIATRGWTYADPVFLKLFGVSGFRINVQAVERPAWGVNSEGQ